MRCAFLPFYKTHFFDPTQGWVALRLVQFAGFGVLGEGLVWGVIVWLLTRWIACVTRPAETS